jgi:hypothetical protein
MSQVRLSVQEADGYLPAVCMRCGKAATATVTKKMQWHPSWVYLLILLHVLIYIIVAMIVTRRAVVQVPFCDEHKGHWFKRNMWMWGTFFLFGIAGVSTLILVGNLDDRAQNDYMPFACIVSVVLLVGWFVIVIVCQNTAIRAKEITDTEILLTGVSEEFVEAVAEADRERLERRAARRRDRERPGHWRDEVDDEDDAPPPRRRPTDDRIQE